MYKKVDSVQPNAKYPNLLDNSEDNACKTIIYTTPDKYNATGGEIH